jgi:hypothetical protein
VCTIFEKGMDPRNRLWTWDWLFKNTLLYPDGFGEMENWQGCVLFSCSLEQPRYSGFLNRTLLDGPEAPDYRASTTYIAVAGISCVRHPHPSPVPLEAVKVRYADEVRTAAADRADPQTGANWDRVYCNAEGDTAEICPLASGDDDTLRPWCHYRV